MWMVCFSQSHEPGSGDSQLSITWRFSLILQCWRTFLDLFALLGCHQSCDGECCKSFHIFEKMNYIDDIFIYSNVVNVTHGNCDRNMRISIPFWQSWCRVHLDFIIGDDLLKQSSTLKSKQYIFELLPSLTSQVTTKK